MILKLVLSAKKAIAEQLGISTIKVNRVLKENNLGKRLVKTSESKRQEIVLFVSHNTQI